MKLRRIIYTSQTTKLFSKRNLLDLLHQSRAYNSVDNITGVLIHRKNIFLQVIEGDPEAIEDLLKRLLLDTRHMKLNIVLDQFTESRIFSNWSMGCADFNKPELSLIPGLRADLSDPDIIQKIITRLPEVSSFLLQQIDE
jgi:EAL domain-containing protein (putative c-di-GMP-specific phosphodiesterase class I)